MENAVFIIEELNYTDGRKPFTRVTKIYNNTVILSEIYILT